MRSASTSEIEDAFFIVGVLDRVKARVASAQPQAAPSHQEVLPMEIRDLLASERA